MAQTSYTCRVIRPWQRPARSQKTEIGKWINSFSKYRYIVHIVQIDEKDIWQNNEFLAFVKLLSRSIQGPRGFEDDLEVDFAVDFEGGLLREDFEVQLYCLELDTEEARLVNSLLDV